MHHQARPTYRMINVGPVIIDKFQRLVHESEGTPPPPPKIGKAKAKSSVRKVGH